MLKNIFKTVGWKLALLAGLLNFAFFLFLFYVFPENQPYQVFKFGSIFITGGFLIYAIYRYKKIYKTNEIHLSEAFLTGAVVAFLATAILAVIFYFFLRLNPEALATIKESLIEFGKQNLELINDEKTAEQIKNQLEQIKTAKPQRFAFDIFSKHLFALFFLNLLAAAFFRNFK